MTEEHRLTGHGGSVLCVRVFRGRLLFSGSVDGTVKVSLRSCLTLGGAGHVRKQRPDSHACSALELYSLERVHCKSPGRCTAERQQLLQVWDLETCKCVGTLLRAAKPVAHLELAAGRLYASSVRCCDLHISKTTLRCIVHTRSCSTWRVYPSVAAGAEWHS
jgi:CXCXC repeat